jgi:hypothetical protein
MSSEPLLPDVQLGVKLSGVRSTAHSCVYEAHIDRTCLHLLTRIYLVHTPGWVVKTFRISNRRRRGGVVQHVRPGALNTFLVDRFDTSSWSLPEVRSTAPRNHKHMSVPTHSRAQHLHLT